MHQRCLILDALIQVDNGLKVRTLNVSSGNVSTLAGNRSSGNADGVGEAAQFNGLAGIALDAFGTFALVVRGESRISFVCYGSSCVHDKNKNAGGLLQQQNPSHCNKLRSCDDYCWLNDVRQRKWDRLSVFFFSPVRRNFESGQFGRTHCTYQHDSCLYLALLQVCLLFYHTSFTQSDWGNALIRRINVISGEVSTIAGVVGSTSSIDGTAATFKSPAGIATDALGSNLIVVRAFYEVDCSQHE